MHVCTSYLKKRESYTWRRTYPHIRIPSKEVTWEAATTPRGILEMQDKTCLGRYGNSTPPGSIKFTPSYRAFWHSTRDNTWTENENRMDRRWSCVVVGKGCATMISRRGRSWNDLPITPGYRGGRYKVHMVGLSRHGLMDVRRLLI